MYLDRNFVSIKFLKNIGRITRRLPKVLELGQQNKLFPMNKNISIGKTDYKKKTNKN